MKNLDEDMELDTSYRVYSFTLSEEYEFLKNIVNDISNLIINDHSIIKSDKAPLLNSLIGIIDLIFGKIKYCNAEEIYRIYKKRFIINNEKNKLYGLDQQVVHIASEYDVVRICTNLKIGKINKNFEQYSYSLKGKNLRLEQVNKNNKRNHGLVIFIS